jgi:glycerol-3-phosphate acyltransferase PlsX
MAVSPRIAIDAMGGDIGPAVMIAGMARARRKDRSLRFDLFGDEAQLPPSWQSISRWSMRSRSLHRRNSCVGKPSQAIRRAKTPRWGWRLMMGERCVVWRGADG